MGMGDAGNDIKYFYLTVSLSGYLILKSCIGHGPRKKIKLPFPSQNLKWCNHSTGLGICILFPFHPSRCRPTSSLGLVLMACFQSTASCHINLHSITQNTCPLPQFCDHLVKKKYLCFKIFLKKSQLHSRWAPRLNCSSNCAPLQIRISD